MKMNDVIISTYDNSTDWIPGINALIQRYHNYCDFAEGVMAMDYDNCTNYDGVHCSWDKRNLTINLYDNCALYMYRTVHWHKNCITPGGLIISTNEEYKILADPYTNPESTISENYIAVLNCELTEEQYFQESTVQVIDYPFAVLDNVLKKIKQIQIPRGGIAIYNNNFQPEVIEAVPYMLKGWE